MNETKRGKVSTAAIGVTGILAVIGIGIYSAEHAGALSSNLSNAVPWGIYLAFFMLFAGVGAGCLIMAAAPRAFGAKSLDLGLSRELAWVGFAALLLAGVCITIDLGNPLRMFELLLAPHPASPLFWDVLALPVAIILALAYALGAFRKAGAASRVFDVAVACWGVFVLCVDAWILCSQGAHETWASSILMPWFVVTGVLCGAAAELLLAAWRGVDSKAVAKFTAGLIVADVVMFALDLVCADGAARSMYLTGQLAPLFWAQMVLYAAALAACAKAAAGDGETAGAFPAVAGIAVLLGVAAKRLALMTSGFQLPAFTLPAKVEEIGALVYFPAPTEILCAAGMVGLGLLIVLLGFRFLAFDAGRE